MLQGLKRRLNIGKLKLVTHELLIFKRPVIDISHRAAEIVALIGGVRRVGHDDLKSSVDALSEIKLRTWCVVAAHQNQPAALARAEHILRTVQESGYTRALYDKIRHVPARYLTHALHIILRFAVDGMRCAERPREFKLLIVYIDGDEPRQQITGQRLNTPLPIGPQP